MASYGGDEQRCSTPVRTDPNMTVIFERLLNYRSADLFGFVVTLRGATNNHYF